MFKGIITLVVSARVAEIVKEKGAGQAQVTVHFPPKTELKLSKKNQATVTIYRIPADKKVTKDCLVGEFTQADSHAIWLGHQTEAGQAKHKELFASLTEAGTQFYAIYTPKLQAASAQELALDVSELN